MQDLVHIRGAAHSLFFNAWSPLLRKCQRMQWQIVNDGLHYKEMGATTDYVQLNIVENAFVLDICANIRQLYVDENITKWDLWFSCIKKSAENSLEHLSIKFPNRVGDIGDDLNEDPNLTMYHLITVGVVAPYLTHMEMINLDREPTFGENFKNLAEIVYTDSNYSPTWTYGREQTMKIEIDGWAKIDINNFMEYAKQTKLQRQILKNLPLNNPEPIKDLSGIRQILMRTDDERNYMYLDRETGSIASTNVAWIEKQIVAIFNENDNTKVVNSMGDEEDEKQEGTADRRAVRAEHNQIKAAVQQNRKGIIDQLLIDMRKHNLNNSMKVARILRLVQSPVYISIITTDETYYKEQTHKLKKERMDLEITLKSTDGTILAQTYISHPKKYLLTNDETLLNPVSKPQFATPWTHIALQLNEGPADIIGPLKQYTDLSFFAVESRSTSLLSTILNTMSACVAATLNAFPAMQGVMVYNDDIEITLSKQCVEVVLRTANNLEANLELIPTNGQHYRIDIRWGLVNDKYDAAASQRFSTDVEGLMLRIGFFRAAKSLVIAGNVLLFFEGLNDNLPSLELNYAQLQIEYLRIGSATYHKFTPATRVFPRLHTILLNAQTNLFNANVAKFQLELREQDKEWNHVDKLSYGLSFYVLSKKKQQELDVAYCHPIPEISADKIRNEFWRQRHTFGDFYAISKPFEESNKDQQ